MRSILCAAVLTTLIGLAGCDAVEERKDSTLRTLAGSVFRPIVTAQSKAALTQGTFGTASPVAPKPQRRVLAAATLPVTKPEPVARAERPSLPLAVAAIDFATLTPASPRRTLRGKHAFTYTVARKQRATVTPEATEQVRCKQERATEVHYWDPGVATLGAS